MKVTEAREPVDAGELVRRLRNRDEPDDDCRKAAGMIEELVEALKPYAAVASDDMPAGTYDRRARALLTRIGVRP